MRGPSIVAHQVEAGKVSQLSPHRSSSFTFALAVEHALSLSSERDQQPGHGAGFSRRYFTLPGRYYCTTCSLRERCRDRYPIYSTETTGVILCAVSSLCQPLYLIAARALTALIGTDFPPVLPVQILQTNTYGRHLTVTITSGLAKTTERSPFRCFTSSIACGGYVKPLIVGLEPSMLGRQDTSTIASITFGNGLCVLRMSLSSRVTSHREISRHRGWGPHTCRDWQPLYESVNERWIKWEKWRKAQGIPDHVE